MTAGTLIDTEGVETPVRDVRAFTGSWHMTRASEAAHGLEILLTGTLTDEDRVRADDLLRTLRSASYLAGAFENGATNPFATDDEEPQP